MKRTIGVVAALPFLIAISTWAAAPPDPVYKSLRDAPVETTFTVENLVLQRDAGTITLKNGRLGLTARALERDTVAVFQGEGEFALSPVQPGERAYLKGLTQAETVKETFDRAMFVFTDDTGKEIRSHLKAGAAADPKLSDILHDYRTHLRNLDSENLTAELLTDLYQPGFKGFFSAYFHGRQHSDLRFHVRPRGASLSLGPEEVMAINVQPAGVPDEVWYFSHLASELSSGLSSSGEDHRRVRATSYKIDTTIAKNDHFTATAELAYDALATGDRVLHLDLVSSLRVSNVVSDGKEVPFIQEDRKLDGAFYVVLENPLKAGSEHHLIITYEGDKVVHKAGGGNFSVGARQSWYPNLNSFHDYAHYDLTFRVPKQYTLVSVGKLEKAWQEEGQSCTHWQSDIPLVVAGFNYGVFKRKEIADKTTGFAIDGYANSEMPDYLKEIALRSETTGLESMGATAGTPSLGSMSPSSLMNGTLTEAQNAVRIYSAWFGKPTYNRLALTQQPDFDFGQSWPTLVYLPMSAYLDSTQRWMLVGINKGLSEFVEEVTPHEVAHQWWGHTVSDATYHDAWLSEGFAEFSAGIYLQMTQKPDRVNRFWADARKRILERNKYGHSPNDAGPVSMGFRLNTEKNFAYSTIVYEKGAFVLHMLQQIMYDKDQGDKPFIAMMHQFVEQYRNRNATTEDFQKVAEKYVTPHTDLAGNGKLDWFFSEWVYGTTIPKYTVDYTITPDSAGKFIVKGTLTQSEVPADFGMIVPIYLEFDNGMSRLGTASMAGNHTTPFQVVLPKKPKRVLVNPYNEVLAQ